MEQVVLGEIRRLTRYASQHEEAFIKAVAGFSHEVAESALKQKKRDVAAMQRRVEELNAMFDELFAANMAGKISDEQFKDTTRRYDEEQAALKVRVKELAAEIEKEEGRAMTADTFIGIVRKYTRARKLTERMLNELVEKIVVHHAEKVDGIWQQRLDIHYNCIGTIEIPDELALPTPEVLINTRKGVNVSYTPGWKEAERVAG